MDLAQLHPVILSLRKGDVLFLKTDIDFEEADVRKIKQFISESAGFDVPVFVGPVDPTIIRPG